MVIYRGLRIVACQFLAVIVAVSSAFTAAESEYTSTTAKDPTIPADRLRILLTPLTKDELQVEADAWLAHVRTKAHEIGAAEIAVKFKNEQIQTAKETAEAVEKAEETGQPAPDAAPPAADTPAEASQDKELAAAAAEAEEKARERQAEQAKAAGEPVAVPAAAPQDATTVAKQVVEEEAGVKTALLDHLNVLRDERTELIDRTRVVLGEFKRKGGETDEYEDYLDAVSGIRVESDDLESLWATIFGWLTSKQGGVRWGVNILQFVGIVVVFFFAGRLAQKATERAMRMSRGTSTLMRDFVSKSVRRVFVALGLILGLSALEVNVGPVLAVIGAAGFVIAFALQDTLGNFASGIMNLVYRPFDVGDVVDVAGVSGTVSALSIVSTTIKTFDNKIMIVPNNSVWQNVITNATGSTTRRVDLVFGIGYQDDIDAAQKVLEDIVRQHPKTLDDPPPVIRLHELGDSSVNFVCRPWVKTEDYWAAYWDITQSVKKRFDEEGISIPFPQRDVHVYTAAPHPVNVEDAAD